MSASKSTAILNTNLQMTLKKKLGPRTPKQAALSLLPKFNAGAIILKSIIIINEKIGNLPPLSIGSSQTLVPNDFTNVVIPRYIIDLLRDMRLSNIYLTGTNLTINMGNIPYQFINAVKFVNKTGGVQTILLNSTQTISFPLEPYKNGIPNVNKISFSSSSQPGDYIIITWYNAPLINLAPGYRVVSNNTNLVYNSLDV